MIRTFVVAFFLLLFSVPASAKPNDVYPVSCNDLWAAVKDKLGNPLNYGILTMDVATQTAMFTITGATRVRINSVALAPQDSGCQFKLTAKESGFGTDEETTFRKRVAKSLAKLQAAKPAPSPKAPGQM